MTRPAHSELGPPSGLDEALVRVRVMGGRLTPVKRAVLEAFYAAPDGVTIDDLRACAADADDSTLYRTLVQLEQLGIVEHVHLGHGSASYRLAGSDTVPLVCEECGATVALGLRELRTLARRVRAEHGFVLDVHHFALTGRCATCALSSPA